MDEDTTNVEKSNRDYLQLSTPLEKIEEIILTTNDFDELNNFTKLFNLNIKKKELLRISVLSDLQDSISEQMRKRIEKNSDEFSNKDLLDYFKTIHGTISSSDPDVVVSDKPDIQINQNNVNINLNNNIDDTSRQRVMDAIRSIMANSSNANDDNVIEVEEVSPNQEGENSQ